MALLNQFPGCHNHSSIWGGFGDGGPQSASFRRSSGGGGDLHGMLLLEQSSVMMEKRRLFLRSYQFCRKRSLAERIKASLVRAKKVVWSKLRSARRLRRLVWSRLRFALFQRRRRRFARLLNNYYNRSESYRSW